MFGHAARSGEYHCYVCATAHRDGKNTCDAKPVPRYAVEERVLERVQAVILQEAHLENLVRLTNDRLEASLETAKAELAGLQAQNEDIDRRLERLCDAIETGKLDLDSLAPRIGELKEKRDLVRRAPKLRRLSQRAG